jgi:NAD-dependent histone deacetylase SIR2
MSFLNSKGWLNLIYTQNIDSLELKTKIPKEKIVFAHGNLLESHCAGCKKDYDHEKLHQHIKEGTVLFCDLSVCKSPLKPKVVFYGENLPSNFFEKQNQLFNSDLGIVMGTSLKVMPFSFLPYSFKKSAYRLVVNREKVGLENVPDGFLYDSLDSLDLFLEGSTDEIVIKIIQDCGWKDEFDKYIHENSN